MPRVLRSLGLVGAVAAFALAGSAWATAEREAGTRGTVILGRKHLRQPTALAFNRWDGSLWIVDRGGDLNRTLIVDRPGTRRQRITAFEDRSEHYLKEPMAIAFARDRPEHVTVQDAPGFQGPTLWTSNRKQFFGGQESHLDMLHHSPHSVGVAPGLDTARREYWVVNASERSIDRNFFNEPHPLGSNDHRDGLTYRYAAGSLRVTPRLPSHAVLDAAGGFVYVADPGNGRVVRLNARGAPERPVRIADLFNETPLYLVLEPSVETFVDDGLDKPAGLALHAGILYVGDYGTGRIHRFRLDARPLGAIDTGFGAEALTGIAVTPGRWLYALDWKRRRLVRFKLS